MEEFRTFHGLMPSMINAKVFMDGIEVPKVVCMQFNIGDLTRSRLFCCIGPGHELIGWERVTMNDIERYPVFFALYYADINVSCMLSIPSFTYWVKTGRPYLVYDGEWPEKVQGYGAYRVDMVTKDVMPENMRIDDLAVFTFVDEFERSTIVNLPMTEAFGFLQEAIHKYKQFHRPDPEDIL